MIASILLTIIAILLLVVNVWIIIKAKILSKSEIAVTFVRTIGLLGLILGLIIIYIVYL